MQEIAKIQAAKQWNGRACGEVEGDKGSRDYCARVEEARCRTEQRQKTCFGFDLRKPARCRSFTIEDRVYPPMVRRPFAATSVARSRIVVQGRWTADCGGTCVEL
jgi:hypothetical protein